MAFVLLEIVLLFESCWDYSSIFSDHNNKSQVNGLSFRITYLDCVLGKCIFSHSFQFSLVPTVPEVFEQVTFNTLFLIGLRNVHGNMKSRFDIVKLQT